MRQQIPGSPSVSAGTPWPTKQNRPLADAQPVARRRRV